MWDDTDKNNYDAHNAKGLGQICDDPFSREIERYAADPQYTAFLEIGTWNGRGSTRAFANGLRGRTDDYVFYSLECNADKSADAAALYADEPRMHILNEVIWNDEPSDFYAVFPQALSDAMYRRWNEVDILNMKKCPLFLERKDLPEVFDVLLLDGGEFTTYHEFQALKDRCRVLMLDDINVDKCTLILAEIRASSNWRIVKEDTTRNGFMIAERC